ncbi:MAG TPA: matrixin family metalloprotease [Gemmatimonadaceae bacterium]|nr:matrixin family metalloprotease [Gemmatimonadaceae bacterium]
MKRAVLPLLSLALGLSVLGAIHAPVAEPKPVRHTISSGAIARVLREVAALPSRGADRSSVMQRLRDEESGTYIGDILRERDSSLARWSGREDSPLSVWIQPQSPLDDFSNSYVNRVREAFEAWNDVDLPVQFAFVRDSAQAEVHVNWIDHFDEPISGRTRWARDDDWVITDANIILALHHNQGDLLDDDSMRAMAMHEIGHLLGLDHTTDSLSIMAPKVRVRQLSSADRATARLLYALPTGPLPGLPH